MKKQQGFLVRFYGDEIIDFEKKFQNSQEKNKNEFIKKCIQKSKWNITIDSNYQECRRTFSKISNNMNQIARKVNIEDQISEIVLKLLINIRELLLEILEIIKKGSLK